MTGGFMLPAVRRGGPDRTRPPTGPPEPQPTVRLVAAVAFATMMLATAAGCVSSLGSTPASTAVAATDTSASDVVRTDLGQVRGKLGADQATYTGIPFAAPPVGPLRFRPPQPAAPWAGVRDATGNPRACPQSAPEIGTLLASQEDCLTLDVHTPLLGVGHLPVMVWLYGGAYLFGATGSNPAPLLRAGKVIVVEVNYRVGPFGFLALPGLDAESPQRTSGDAALLDQQAGLRWVQRNIAAFGGDPHNVTIFGESAGGNSVCQQVASPLARGLFAKAITQSGSCSGSALRTLPKAEMVRRSLAYGAELGCPKPATVLACLRGLPQAKLLSSDSVRFATMAVTWQPSIDGYAVPRTLDDAWTSGSFAHVPMIVGNNHDEGRLFVFLQDHLPTLLPVFPIAYEAFVRHSFPGYADRVLARYPVPEGHFADVPKADVITDAFFACPAARTAQRLTGAGDQVWAYELNTVDPPFQVDPYLPLLNAHLLDVFYLFDSIQQFPVLAIPVVRTDRQAGFSAQLATAWTTFARTGDPGGVGGVRWPRWTASSQQVMRLNSAGSTVITNLRADHRCDFWEPALR